MQEPAVPDQLSLGCRILRVQDEEASRGSRTITCNQSMSAVAARPPEVHGGVITVEAASLVDSSLCYSLLAQGVSHARFTMLRHAPALACGWCLLG